MCVTKSLFDFIHNGLKTNIVFHWKCVSLIFSTFNWVTFFANSYHISNWRIQWKVLSHLLVLLIKIWWIFYDSEIEKSCLFNIRYPKIQHVNKVSLVCCVCACNILLFDDWKRELVICSVNNIILLNILHLRYFSASFYIICIGYKTYQINE